MRQSMHELRETDESTMTITLKIPKVSTFTNSHTNHTYRLQISHLECVILFCTSNMHVHWLVNVKTFPIMNQEMHTNVEPNVHIHQTNTTEHTHSNMKMSSHKK